MRVIVPEYEYQKVRDLIWTESGMRQPEIQDVTSSFMGPFKIYMEKEDARTFCEILRESGIHFVVDEAIG